MLESDCYGTAVERDPKKIVRVLERRIEKFIADCEFFVLFVPGRVSKTVSDRFLLSFDHLVASFPALIALAISRLGERGRVVLAKNLFQECGDGDVLRTHHAVYRKFLRSAKLQSGGGAIDDHTLKWNGGLQALILSASSPEVVGAIAAGEILAQPALSKIYEVLRQLYSNTDVEYFTVHLDLEADHVAEIAGLIAVECQTQDSFTGVLSGFDRGLSYWNDWFTAMTRVCSAHGAT